MIYDIIFYAKGKFNDKILEIGYDKKRKIDNYILLIYLLFSMIFFILIIFYLISSKIVLKGEAKVIIDIFFAFLLYFIAQIIFFHMKTYKERIKGKD